MTKHFYDIGWRGINVEPLAHLHEKFERERTEDINICAAVSDISGEAQFFEVEDEQLSTLEKMIALGHAAAGEDIKSYKVPTVTLKQRIAHLERSLQHHRS